MNGMWRTSRIDVKDGTRIEVWDELPGKRGWSHKVGKVHFHGDELHMPKKDCEFIEIKPRPPLRLQSHQRQMWRVV